MVIKIKLNSDFKFPVFLNKLETIGYIKKIDSFKYAVYRYSTLEKPLWSFTMLNFVHRIDVLYSRNEIVLKPSLVGFFFSLLIFQLPLIVWGGFFFFFLIALLDAFFYFIISISIKNIFKSLIELSS